MPSVLRPPRSFTTTSVQLVGARAGVRFDPDYARRWAEYYSTVDQWFHAWKDRLYCDGPESVAISEELVDLGQLKRTEFFNDYLLPQDSVHQLGGAIIRRKRGAPDSRVSAQVVGARSDLGRSHYFDGSFRTSSGRCRAGAENRRFGGITSGVARRYGSI